MMLSNMEIDAKSMQYVQGVADEALIQLECIATEANKKLQDGPTLRSNVLANINTINSGSTINRLDSINQSNHDSYKVLASEPAIARVVVEDRTGNRTAYYICRTSAITDVPCKLASYYSPVGRLASLEVGSEFTLPQSGKVLEVLERARLRPISTAKGWDSQNSILESEHFGPVTIESLRALIKERLGEEAPEDLVAQFLAEDSTKANIINGLRRGVLTKMELRDQPILDRHQDEIFRLPLDKRLMILGPPGTGKTTTLIRRLGQKLNAEFLEHDEKRLVESISASQDVQHAQSWLMFTPTELLKQYLKEAFAREGVPASNLRIRTWQEYRRELARNSFSILKTASGGSFVLREELASLAESALDQPIQWFEDFNEWQRNQYLQDLNEAAGVLQEANLPEIQKIGDRLHGLLAGADKQSLSSIFRALESEVPSIQAIISSLKEASDVKINAALNLQLNRNRSFLDELAHWLDSLQQSQITDLDEQEDLDADEEGDALLPRTGRAAAHTAFVQAVRAQALSAASKRVVGKTTRNGKLIDWLGDRGMTDSDLATVGPSLLVQASARRFVNPIKRFMSGIPKRYRAFRRERQNESSWYCIEGFEGRDIHPLELDIILLTILRSLNELIGKIEMLMPFRALLQTFFHHFHNQILVDEATDFSPIQLACMAALAHPRLRSFFACGDFNQRLTTWGARSSEEMKWIFADIDIKEITVSYRQSKQLNDLACAMIRAVGGADQKVTLPAYVDNDGVAPVLLEQARDKETITKWLADRIREIECFVGQLPSTAIFVNSEGDVAPLADDLKTALAEQNILVDACHQGQTVGQESNVRVFDIQHIKGLEFEAVFFIGIDQLADLHPTLYDKYLYVGATRAATYLGMTCDDKIPGAFESLRSHFGSHWQPTE